MNFIHTDNIMIHFLEFPPALDMNCTRSRPKIAFPSVNIINKENTTVQQTDVIHSTQ